MFEVLRLSDQLNALAVLMAATLAPTDAIERTTGLAAETALRLVARRTPWDAADLARMAEALGAMPRLAEAMRRGIVSFSQARAITREVKGLPRAALERIDAVVGEHAPRLADAEPQELLMRVEDAAESVRAEATLRREERQVEHAFLWLQPRLGGGGRNPLPARRRARCPRARLRARPGAMQDTERRCG